jgi:hypothetical protein
VNQTEVMLAYLRRERDAAHAMVETAQRAADGYQTRIDAILKLRALADERVAEAATPTEGETP